jgi:hypothetical protein
MKNVRALPAPGHEQRHVRCGDELPTERGGADAGLCLAGPRELESWLSPRSLSGQCGDAAS